VGARDFAAGWFGVRCIFQWRHQATYEERITVWHADSFDAAIRKAEFEASEYAEANELIYLGLAQGFWIFGNQIAEGTEVFSLLRMSDLKTDDYLDTFYDSGQERQSHWAGEDSSDLL
jgi:transglutaminase-like putative cysteine protease